MKRTKKLNPRQNNSLEFYRIVCTLIICFHHAKGYLLPEISKELMPQAYLCVEFFFILSGYFLHRSFINEKKHSTLNYTTKRMKRLYPEYVVVAAAYIGFYKYMTQKPLNLPQAANELLMVQNTGLYNLGGYNYPCWYIPVMFVAGVFIYAGLTHYGRKFSSFIMPIVILGGYTYIMLRTNSAFEDWGTVGPFSVPVVRALCGMGLGVLISQIQDRVEIPRWIATLVEIAAAGTIAIGMIRNYFGVMTTIIAFAALVLICATKRSYLYSIVKHIGAISFVGKYTYILYLNHAFMVMVMRYLDTNNIYEIGERKLYLYPICLIVYSVVLKTIIDLVMKLLNYKPKKKAKKA